MSEKIEKGLEMVELEPGLDEISRSRCLTRGVESYIKYDTAPIL